MDFFGFFFCSNILSSGYSFWSEIGDSLGGNLEKPSLSSIGEEKFILFFTNSSKDELNFEDFSFSETRGEGGDLVRDPPPLLRVTLFPRYSSFFFGMSPLETVSEKEFNLFPIDAFLKGLSFFSFCLDFP